MIKLIDKDSNEYKTSFLVTFHHTNKIDMAVIYSALEKMAGSFHNHPPILEVDISEVSQIEKPLAQKE